jgi:hypothetical protein
MSSAISLEVARVVLEVISGVKSGVSAGVGVGVRTLALISTATEVVGMEDSYRVERSLLYATSF